MEPTIPQLEQSIFTEPNENSGVESASGSMDVQKQDRESRESKNGPSSGWPADDDSAQDDARAQLQTIAKGDDSSIQQTGAAPSAPQSSALGQSTNDDFDNSVFINKLKDIIRKDADNPSEQSEGVAGVQAEYLLKRFNHKVPKYKG